MSLVAYGSSDDSDLSDTEENKPHDKPVESQNFAVNDDQVTETENKQVQDDQISDSDSETPGHVRENDQNNLDDMLKELPTPKTADSGVIVENDALEDIVKPKPSQVADVEKPVPKKLRQPVKITIPALPDSDDDGDEPVKKKPRPGFGTGKSGLTSILPAPVHAAKKETGRILLPYSLTKKTQSVASGAPAPKKSSNITSQVSDKSRKLSASLADYGSDSEDEDDTGEPVSFFSFDSSVNKTNSTLKSKIDSTVKSSEQKEMVGPSLPPMHTGESNLDTGIPTVPLPPTLPRTSLHLPAPARNDNSSVNDNAVNEPVSPSDSGLGTVPIGPFVDPNAPLTFKGGVSSQKTYGGFYNSNNAMSSSSSSLGSSHSVGEGDQNMYYNMRYDDSMQYPESTDVEGFQQDNEFLRLQGKKQRGKEEINLIDVNADDYTDPSEVTKYLSEEQTHQSHRKKDNQPSGQQKRKHQIHYLAFQAKERELELKNQWSQNRQTKKQTQAKYGF
ncbi:proline-rich protein PRCC-like [Mercenaria mercenaria]|uniref:proline-rich protein PRCC-like n=1 Tax=Mercenaria mercenaria TaxID=6596 RepID=UPI001E1D7A44|nr:proline-rich protein PRCC-like [Mercenaria mercenaria]